MDPLRAAGTVASTFKDVAVRLADAGIDPLTIEIALQLSLNFDLSSEAFARMSSAINSLPQFSSAGNLLWFGFGIEHIVRKLAKSTVGVKCLALCGCIAEVYTPETASVILYELAVLCVKAPELPTPPQWKALVDACQGVLASTDFGRTAEKFMGLNRDPSFPSESIYDRLMGDPKDIVRVFQVLFISTDGETCSTTITGGFTCGWIAAIAHWFMGYSVEIRPPREPPSVFKAGSKQLVVEYLGQDFQGPASFESKSFVINNVKKIIYLEACHSDLPAGRLQWSEAIRVAFGGAGRILLDEDATFSLIGSVARLLTGFARADPETEADFETLQNWVGYRHSSYGSGYVSFAKQQFPELRQFDQRDSMGDCAGESYETALQNFSLARQELTTLCGCEFCLEDSKKKTTFCLPMLTEVIVLLIWGLSLIKFDVMDKNNMPMNPNHEGVEAFYYHCSKLLNYRPSDNHSTEELPARRLFNLMNLPQVFTTAECVFAGGLSSDPSLPGRLASVSGCICMYLDILRDATDQPKNTPLLHVLPGGIQLQSGKKCTYIEDGLPTRRNGDVSLFTPKFPPHGHDATSSQNSNLNAYLRAQLSLANEVHGPLTASMIATETTQTGKLKVSVRIDSDQGTFEVGPRRMLDHILRASSTAKYPRQPHTCGISSPSCKATVLVDGISALTLTNDRWEGNNVNLHLLRAKSLGDCLGSLALPVGLSEGSQLADLAPDVQLWAVILRSQCLPCFIRAMVDAHRREIDYLKLLPFANEEFLDEMVTDYAPIPCPPSVRVWTYQNLSHVFKELFSKEEPIPHGMSRVKWKCVCGDNLYDDYLELKPGAAKELENCLRRSSHRLRKSSYQSIIEGTERFGYALRDMLSMIGQQLKNLAPRQEPKLVETEMRYYSEARATRNPAQSSAEVFYLLLCHNAGVGADVVKLRQLDICDINTDRKLFQFMQDEYNILRKRWGSWISLWALQTIRFARFELYEDEIVDIRKLDEVPPPERDGEYRHGPPNPPELHPPIGSNLLMHCFMHPDKIGPGKKRLRKIPRRLKERLALVEDDRDTIGWGLQFVEGWSKKRLMYAVAVSFGLASFLLLILLSIMGHNIQNAAAIASFMLSLVTIWIATLQTGLHMS